MLSEFPIGPWMPDAPSFQNPGCEVADGVRATARGFGPFHGFSGSGKTISSAPKGVAQFYDNSSVSVIVGGMDDKLFVLRSSVAETTGLTSLGDGEAWDFAQFNDFVIATAINNSPQYLTDIDTDNTWSALPGSPPTAKRCARVGDFLVLGNIAGAKNRIQWSAFNSPATSWAADRLTQAGYLDLPKEFGAVQKIVGGRYATVFQERGITRLSYVGPPSIWRADTISEGAGALAAFGVATAGYTTYFLSQNGFYMTDGSSVSSIGNWRVNQWFIDNVDQTHIGETQGAVDWQNSSIVWAFYGAGATGRTRLIVFNYSSQMWSTATVDTGWVFGSTLSGTDIDSLDAIYTDLDSIPVSLDSDLFKDRGNRLGAFQNGATTSEYGVFAGDAMEATIETGEFQPSPGQRVFVSEVTPVFDAEDADETVTLLIKDNRNNPAVSATATVGWGGFAPVRGEGQKMALRIVKPSGVWEDASHIQVRARPAGYR